MMWSRMMKLRAASKRDGRSSPSGANASSRNGSPVSTSALAREVLGAMDREKQLPGISKVRFGVFTEGPAVQTLHNGTRADKWTTLDRLRSFIERKGYEVRGRHHEIYLSDPRTITEERMKMILRLPIR